MRGRQRPDRPNAVLRRAKWAASPQSLAVSRCVPVQVRARSSPLGASIPDVSSDDRRFERWAGATRQRGRRNRRNLSGEQPKRTGDRWRNSCQVSRVTALPADNSMPASKPLIITTAPSARPPCNVNPIGAGSPEMPRDDCTSNFGVSGSFRTARVADVTGSDEPCPIVWLSAGSRQLSGRERCR